MTIDREAVHPMLRKACQQAKWKNVIFVQDDFVMINDQRIGGLMVHFVDDHERKGTFGFDEDVREQVEKIISKRDHDEATTWVRGKIAEEAPSQRRSYSLDRFEVATPRM